jgi:hypothetical protein
MDEKLKNIILDYKSLSNKDLEYAMDELGKDFESTKSLLITLTHHLDSLEMTYEQIRAEYKNRMKI